MNLSKSLASFRANITRRNHIWESATPAEKRVMLSKEVISLVKRELVGLQGGYFWPNMEISLSDSMPVCSIAVKAASDGIQCDVCAIGAVALAFCFHGGDIRLEFGGDIKIDTVKALEGIFDRDTLEYMEGLFEGWYYRLPNCHQSRLAAKFYHMTRHQRIIAIFDNIVKHNGELDLSAL